MKKDLFLERLEYLLQDIPEEDKRDAIDYYRDYLEEAGTENEEAVLQEFGSPERIASIIRTDLLGGMEGGGEFTENGFADQRFARQALPAISNKQPKGEENTENYRSETYRKGSYADQGTKVRKTEGKSGNGNKTLNNWLKFFLILIGVLVFAPIILTVAVGSLGGAIGIGGALLALLLVAGVLTFVGFACGILLFILGFSQLFFNLWFGIMMIGLGLAFTGAGCLLLICSVLFYGRFLPWMFRGIAGLFRRIFGKQGNNKSKTDSRKDMYDDSQENL